MMLFLAISFLIVAVVVWFVLVMAWGMSDNPMGPGPNFWPVYMLLAISAFLFICHHFGWHPSW